MKKFVLAIVLIALVALAFATPAAAVICTRDNRPDCLPPPVIETGAILVNGKYVVNFYDLDRTVVVVAGGTKYLISFMERYNNAYFETRWACLDSPDGSYVYQLWIIPKQPIKVYA